MLRILFYITSFPDYGGIEKVTAYLADYLQRRGYDVSILSFHNGAPGLFNELTNHVKITFAPNQKIFLCNENEIFIQKFFSTHDFDWVIYQDCYSPIHELLFKTSFPVHDKLIVVEHSSPCCHLQSYQNYWKRLRWNTFHDIIRKIVYPYKKQKLYKRLSQRHTFLLNACHNYVLLSDNFRQEIAYLVGAKYERKLTAIPNPVTLPETNSNHYVKDKKQMVFIGRLVEDKGIDYLVQIWTAFEQQANDWQLLIIGDGPLRKQVASEIVHRGLKRVSMLGAQPNVTPYLEDASALLMTSIFEGFPLVLSEAMSRGCVPIAFNSFASLSDIIDDQVNGIIIPPFQISEYVKQLTNLTTASHTLAQLSDSAIRKAKTFHIDEVGKRWVALLDKK